MNAMQLTQSIHLLPPQLSNKRGRSIAQPTFPGWEKETEKLIVTNRQIAEVLSNIADILETQKSNPYRIQAYRNAARGILELAEPATTILRRKESLPVPGLGQRLRGRIAELVETGSMTFYSDLCFQSLPREARALMTIPHVGIHTAFRLYQELGIDTAEKLWHAAHQQRIRHLAGFGPRSEARLREAAEQVMARKTGAPLPGAA